MRPITPAQVGEAKGSIFPPEVIQAFNECIASHFVRESANFTQKEVKARIVELMQKRDPHFHQSMILQRGWLNVEAYYESVGWKVSYDKPAYCENYDANFTFTQR